MNLNWFDDWECAEATLQERHHLVFTSLIGFSAISMIERERDNGPEVAFSAADEIANRYEVFASLQEKVESPIEKIMASVLPFARDGYEYVLTPESAAKLGSDWHTTVEAQADAPPYRLDFLLTCRLGGRRARLAVECDGHNFHEKTKEQAARDKSRDRALAAAGITVLRFTGSEIHRQPYRCLRDVEVVLARMMDGVLGIAVPERVSA